MILKLFCSNVDYRMAACMHLLDFIQKQSGVSHQKFLKSIEVYEFCRIKRLQTTYSFGLNDKILGQWNIT